MRHDVTRDFDLAESKGIQVFYNDATNNYEVVTYSKVHTFYDDEDGEGYLAAEHFIDECDCV